VKVSDLLPPRKITRMDIILERTRRVARIYEGIRKLAARLERS
jgi:hypothetical protein